MSLIEPELFVGTKRSRYSAAARSWRLFSVFNFWLAAAPVFPGVTGSQIYQRTKEVQCFDGKTDEVIQ